MSKENLQIHIKNLTFYGIIGLLKNERENEQKIIVDAKIKYHYDKDSFINYADIAQLIKSILITKKFELLEEALEVLAQEIKTKFPQSNQIKLKISKPDILRNCTVGVKIKKNFKKN
ncbi:MAG: dihydroneopterin aldolase [Sulfurospirillum sp.]